MTVDEAHLFASEMEANRWWQVSTIEQVYSGDDGWLVCLQLRDKPDHITWVGDPKAELEYLIETGKCPVILTPFGPPYLVGPKPSDLASLPPTDTPDD